MTESTNMNFKTESIFGEGGYDKQIFKTKAIVYEMPGHEFYVILQTRLWKKT